MAFSVAVKDVSCAGESVNAVIKEVEEVVTVMEGFDLGEGAVAREYVYDVAG